MEKEPVITSATPIEEIERIGDRCGKELKVKFDAKDYGHAFSDLIHTALITRLSDHAAHLNIPLDEIRNSRRLLYLWHEMLPTFRILKQCLPYWFNLNVLTMRSAPLMARLVNLKDLDITHDICMSCAVYCLTAVWYGAKPECKRVIINNRRMKQLNETLKKYGVPGIHQDMYVASVAAILLWEKVLIHDWERFTSGKDERSINSMSAHAQIQTAGAKKSKAVSSFADLALLKEAK